MNISEADTAVVMHPVEMAVPSAHPTPRGSPEALILWLPVHSRHCTSLVAPAHPDTAQLHHLMEMRSWDLVEALVPGNQKQRVTLYLCWLWGAHEGALNKGHAGDCCDSSLL